jgi:hypothetical protein
MSMPHRRIALESTRKLLGELLEEAKDEHVRFALQAVCVLIDETLSAAPISETRSNRIDPRISHLTATTLQTAVGEELDCGISDISAGGALVFIGSEMNWDIGDMFLLDVPWLSARVQCEIRAIEGDRYHVRFLQLDERARLSIEKALLSGVCR